MAFIGGAMLLSYAQNNPSLKPITSPAVVAAPATAEVKVANNNEAVNATDTKATKKDCGDMKGCGDSKKGRSCCGGDKKKIQ